MHQPGEGVIALKEYVQFIWNHRRFLTFGVLMAFFSSFGQTYFIALFSEAIREEFSLDHGAFGLIYSGATLCSGMLLVWAGGRIDHVDLRIFTVLVCLGMIAACIIMAFAQVIAWLAVSLFLLRFCGQGLFSHISTTSMARYFDEGRGKAISIGTLGNPAGEALLPVAAVAMIAAVGWRETWGILAVTLCAVMIPLTFWLLRGHSQRHEALIASMRRRDAESAGEIVPASNTVAADQRSNVGARQWLLREVLRDLRFYLLLPAALGPPMIVTGMFFHQVHLVDLKGWSMTWYAGCFVGFAATQLPVSLLSGYVIDRIGATRLLPVFLIPLMAGLAVVALGSHPLIALVYLMLVGVTIGMVMTTVNASWAELYGVLHLGSIRAVTGALMVVSTALAPGGFGLLIDRGVSLNVIAGGALVYAACASGVAWLAISLSPKSSDAQPVNRRGSHGA